MNDLDAAPLEWRRAEHGQSLRSDRWQHHCRSRCRSSTAHRGPTSRSNSRTRPAAKTRRSTTRLDSGLSNGSSQVSQLTQATLSASKSGIGCKRARDIAAPAHLGALTTAKPRIQPTIQDAVWASLPPEQPLETRQAHGHRNNHLHVS